MAGYRSCIEKMLCKEHKKAFLNSQDLILILKESVLCKWNVKSKTWLIIAL